MGVPRAMTQLAPEGEGLHSLVMGAAETGGGGSTIFLDYARSAQAAKRQGGGPSVSPLTLRRNTPPCSGGCQEAIPPTRRPGGRATAAARGGAGTGRRPAPQRIRGRTGPLAAASVGMPQGCAPLAARRETGGRGRGKLGGRALQGSQRADVCGVTTHERAPQEGFPRVRRYNTRGGSPRGVPQLALWASHTFALILHPDTLLSSPQPILDESTVLSLGEPRFHVTLLPCPPSPLPPSSSRAVATVPLHTTARHGGGEDGSEDHPEEE